MAYEFRNFQAVTGFTRKLHNLHLSFDEGSGDTAKDDSGYGNNATLYNCIWSTDRKFGNSSIYLNGEDSYGKITNSDSLNNPYFSVAFWFKIPERKDQFFYTHKDGTNGHEIVIYEDYLRFYIAIDDTWYYTGLSMDYVPLDKWNFVCGTYDGKFLRLYFNGRLYARNEVNLGGLPYVNRDICIGANNFGGYKVHGFIDEFWYFPTVLTPSQVYDLYYLNKTLDYVENYHYVGTQNIILRAYLYNTDTNQPVQAVDCYLFIYDTKNGELALGTLETTDLEGYVEARFSLNYNNSFEPKKAFSTLYKITYSGTYAQKYGIWMTSDLSKLNFGDLKVYT